jgi:beta-lactamase class A
VLTYLGEPLELTLADVATLMIIVSDNTATNLCIDVAGIDGTNQLIEDLGLSSTVLRRKMQDHEAVARGEENVATPNECVKMLQLLYEGRPAPEVAKRCIAILKKRKSATLFSSAIPRTVPLANKPGGMSRVRCDAGIVFLERRPYAMAIMTKYALCEHPDQERFIIDTARLIHGTMSVLADTNQFGQGLES